MLLPYNLFSFAAEQVTGGSLKVDVKFGIIPVFDKTYDLCDLAKEAGLSCPVSAGTHTTKITEDVPSIPLHVSKGYYISAYRLSMHVQTLLCKVLDIAFPA